MRSPLFDVDRPSKVKPNAYRGFRWKDEARFIKTWLESPLTTGAVSPSSRSLSRMMARYVDPSIPGPIIELGPGTGPVTDALIRRGVAPERLVLVEFEPAFCKLLSRRYPGCRVVQGDAYALGATLSGLLFDPAAAIVSSLPLLTRPERQRYDLLGDAFALMRPDAPFIQFTYGLTSPIPRQHRENDLGFDAKVSAPVWLNLPPARVWIYRRATAGGDAQDRVGVDLFDKIKAGRDKLGEEWREQRQKLRTEILVRSSEARAEFRMRALKVKIGLELHKARVIAERTAKPARQRVKSDRLGDRRSRW
nr:ribose ABC transporter permease [Lichenihabitans psoromatis]